MSISPKHVLLIADPRRTHPYGQFDFITIHIDSFDFEVNSDGGALIGIECVVDKPKQQAGKVMRTLSSL